MDDLRIKLMHPEQNSVFFIVVKYNIKFTILSVQFSGIKYIHIFGQPSPLLSFRTFLSSQIEIMYPSNNNFRVLPSL